MRITTGKFERYLACTALLSAAGAASAAPRDYRFDTVHTQVFFSTSHLGYSHPSGRLRVSAGFVRFDADDWKTAQVDVTVDVASLDMGDAAWNDKLRSREFLAAERYPTARFVSKSVEKTGERSGVVHGALTLLGATRPLDLAVTFNKAGVDPYTFRSTIGFSASASLKRSAFGMVKYLPDVGDVVDLRIEVEGLRDRDAQENAAPAPNQTPQTPTES